MAILFYTLRVLAINLRKSPNKYFLIFSFRCLIFGLNSGLTCHKPTHYLLDYGDFFLSTRQIDQLRTNILQQLTKSCENEVSLKLIYKQFFGSTIQINFDLQSNVNIIAQTRLGKFTLSSDTVIQTKIGHLLPFIQRLQCSCR